MDGYAASLNMPDLREMELERFCNFIWWWSTRNASEPAEVDKFKAQLWKPLPGEAVKDKESPWSPESEANAFSAFKKQLGR